jgi:hypothetical protein
VTQHIAEFRIAIQATHAASGRAMAEFLIVNGAEHRAVTLDRISNALARLDALAAKGPPPDEYEPGKYGGVP